MYIIILCTARRRLASAQRQSKSILRSSATLPNSPAMPQAPSKRTRLCSCRQLSARRHTKGSIARVPEGINSKGNVIDIYIILYLI